MQDGTLAKCVQLCICSVGFGDYKMAASVV
jgi:hypothetical protein